MAWMKGAVLNILAPSFIIDKKVSKPYLIHHFTIMIETYAKWLTDIFKKMNIKNIKFFLF